MVEPPCRTVVFSSQEQGTSLVAEIARILCADGTPAGEADAAARTVYARWTERARRGDALVVEGVGVLKYKHFSLDEAFDLRLNPQGHAPMKIRSGRPDWVIWVGAAAVVAAVGIGVCSFLLNDTERPQPLAGTAVPGLATAESPVSPACRPIRFRQSMRRPEMPLRFRRRAERPLRGALQPEALRSRALRRCSPRMRCGVLRDTSLRR